MHTFTQLLEAWGLAFVVLNVLADQSGLPIPSYPTLIAASALAPQAGYAPVHVAAVAVIAAFLADAAWYVAGVRRGRSVLCALRGQADGVRGSGGKPREVSTFLVLPCSEFVRNRIGPARCKERPIRGRN